MNLRKVEERDTITRVPLLFCICFPKRIAQRVGWSVNLLVSLVAASAASFISCERTASEGSSILVKRYVSIVGFIS